MMAILGWVLAGGMSIVVGGAVYIVVTIIKELNNATWF